MKKLVVPTIVLLSLSSCQKKTASAPEDNSAAKTTEIAQELRELEQQEEKLKREIELEKLAMEREELRLQREELASKGARLSEEELALEKKKTALAEQRAEAEAQKAREQNRPLPAQSVPSPTSTERQVSTSALGDYDYSIFYNRLASQGSWFQSPQYGYIWRPSIARAQADWRPYTYGSWVYSDMGWTWISTEPFGWATYHYGRWVLLRNTGWCWVPGNQWAPAWVCWKSNGNYIGWAPLPPESLYWRGDDYRRYYGAGCGISPRCFSFVRINSFGGPIHQSVFSSSECVRIYQSTQYVGGYQFHNNQIICQGISYQNACTAIGRKLPHYACDFNGRPPTTLDPVRYAATRGDRLTINAPNLNVPWNGALRPRNTESSLDSDQVIREKSFDKSLLSRFANERNEDQVRSKSAMRTGLAQKMSERIQLSEKIAEQRVELAKEINESVPTEVAKDKPGRPNMTTGETTQPNEVASEEPRRERPTRPRPSAEDVPAPQAPVEPEVTTTEEVPAAPQEPAMESSRNEGLRPNREEPTRPSGASRLREQQQQAALEQQATSQQKEQQQEMNDRNRRQTEEQAQQQEAMRAQQEAAAEEAKIMAQQQEEALKVQQEAARDEAQMREQQQQEAMQTQEDAAAREEQLQQQQEAMREQQETAAREAEMQQQQAQAMREQQEAAAREAEMQQQQAQAMREQQAAAAREAEMQQQQAQAMREQQEAAARQAEMQQQQAEAMRQQQQEAQERAREESMRQQQEAQQRAQEEQARQQQEAQERAREEQARQQQEAQRQQQ